MLLIKIIILNIELIKIELIKIELIKINNKNNSTQTVAQLSYERW